MFTQLRLKNFKAWCDNGADDTPITVDLAPVTILLGTNSSGKSSLLQSLLLLKQTVESPDRNIHLNLGGDEINDYFNFGHFKDVLSQGASSHQFEIGFNFRKPSDLSSKKNLDEGKFHAKYTEVSGATVIQELFLEAGEKSYKLIKGERGAYSVFANDETQELGKRKEYAPERSIALSPLTIQWLSLDRSHAEDTSLAIRRELENIAYLGPLRRKPERDYVWNRTKPGQLGVDGNHAITALLASADSRSRDASSIVNGVSKWLERMKIAEKLEVRPLGHSRYEIVVHKDGIEANLRDVGIGISQVLPVLILGYFVPQGATILLEEPEIHLHPLAQSVLAEFFTEVSRDRHIQFIVETHSEHLFRRLQTLVAGEHISPKDCCLYFVEQKKGKASLQSLTLDSYGRIQHWPDKFFGDTLGETREQARYMFERQKKENQK